MSKIVPNSLHFRGFIRGIKYRAYLTNNSEMVDFKDFDINNASSYAVINKSDAQIAYSKWVSPKRTRSYPFARIYNTYNGSKILTVIPIIKDEGKDGDLDKLQYSTLSWMNLLNVYVVLAYYQDAQKNVNRKQISNQKLTAQKFDNRFVKSQIEEIFDYKQSALHWNKNLFEERFTNIFRQALDAYKDISVRRNVEIHSHNRLEEYRQKIIESFEDFKNISLKSSQSARDREVATFHKFEHLNDGIKATLQIENYLGGIYYLTIDEVRCEQEVHIIQESKNSTRKPLPDLSDIQDGLFKLILYTNIDSLYLNDQKVEFIVRLKLTGKGILGSLIMPCDNQELDHFIASNSSIFSRKETNTILQLSLEAENNPNLQIEIGANS